MANGLMDSTTSAGCRLFRTPSAPVQARECAAACGSHRRSLARRCQGIVRWPFQCPPNPLADSMRKALTERTALRKRPSHTGDTAHNPVLLDESPKPRIGAVIAIVAENEVTTLRYYEFVTRDRPTRIAAELHQVRALAYPFLRGKRPG